MRIRIDSVKILNSTLQLEGDLGQFLQFVQNFKPATYSVVKHGEKRSNDANAYAWVLISQIADKLHKNPIDVYKDELKYVPLIDIPMRMRAECVEDFTATFVGSHIGRNVIVQDDSDPEFVYVICRKGSSDFDVERMSAFIDILIQDCKALGIETEEEDYINSLLEEWNEK